MEFDLDYFQDSLQVLAKIKKSATVRLSAKN